MSAAYLTMSHRELDRSEVMRLLERRLSHRQAAVMLGLSTRQCERLFARYKRAGPQALVSQKCGRASNRKLPEDQRTDALELVRRHYADFGPTLAHEKLVEQHGDPVVIRKKSADIALSSGLLPDPLDGVSDIGTKCGVRALPRQDGV